ncbi:hypothetical protein DMUE_5878 [Dictyocoela muelleri]|nr:hypothetical protein DMUE_5878 [Dictyocoela muelleri]
MVDLNERSASEDNESSENFKNSFSCYGVNNDDENFIEETKIEVLMICSGTNSDFINKDVELSIDEPLILNDIHGVISHLEAFEGVTKLENYFLKYYPEDLEVIYSLKKNLEDNKSKRNVNLLDFFKKRNKNNFLKFMTDNSFISVLIFRSP